MDGIVLRILISGYNYPDPAGPSWLYSSCSILGSYDKGVRLGYNTTTSKCCILLGTTSTVWRYVSVFLKEVMHQLTTANWSTGYSISLITDESNITNIVTPPLDTSHHLSVTANNGFYKGTLGNGYLLEAGGGHKAITDFATASHTHTISAITDLTTVSNLSNYYNKTEIDDKLVTKQDIFIYSNNNIDSANILTALNSLVSTKSLIFLNLT